MRGECLKILGYTAGILGMLSEEREPTSALNVASLVVGFTRPEQEEKEDEKQQQEDSKRSEALAHIKSVRGKPRGIGSKVHIATLRMFLSNHLLCKKGLYHENDTKSRWLEFQWNTLCVNVLISNTSGEVCLLRELAVLRGALLSRHLTRMRCMGNK